jgi:hypothetical protein
LLNHESSRLEEIICLGVIYEAQNYKAKSQNLPMEGFSGGVELPEQTLGYIVIERTFKVFKDGNLKLDSAYPEKLLTINDEPINYLWNEAVLQEFFPGFTGYELERVI